jgi:hypothetical protein
LLRRMLRVPLNGDSWVGEAPPQRGMGRPFHLRWRRSGLGREPPPEPGTKRMICTATNGGGQLVPISADCRRPHRRAPVSTKSTSRPPHRDKLGACASREQPCRRRNAQPLPLDRARPGGCKPDTIRSVVRPLRQCCRASTVGQSRNSLSSCAPLLCPGPRRCVPLQRQQRLGSLMRLDELVQNAPQHPDSR